MKVSLIPCIIALAYSASFAQEIKFYVATPHPDFHGGLMGDMDFSDVDGDGDLDFFLCGRRDGWSSNDSSSLYLNDGLSQFTIDENAMFPNVQFAAAVFQDLDNDGDEDFLLSGVGDGSEKVGQYYLNDGSGGFTPSTNLPLVPSENGGFAIGDIDGDGDIDVLQYGSTGALGETIPFIKHFENLGNSQFDEVATSQFQAYHTFQLADVDGDGDLDLMASTATPNTQSTNALFENDGNGNFSLVAEPVFSDLKNSYFTIGDLDGDQDADILVSGENTTNESTSELYLNDGNWGFTLFADNGVFPDLSTGENSFHDLDNDGDLDILMSGTKTGGLSGGIVTNIMENQGGNTYVLSDSLTGSYFSNNAAGDIDGDGYLDLVLSGTTVGTPTFKTWVYFNQGAPITNVRDQAAPLGIECYPNPTSGALTISSTQSEVLFVQLYTATGQHVWSKTLEGRGADLRLNQPAGIYTLMIQAGDAVVTQRVHVVQ